MLSSRAAAIASGLFLLTAATAFAEDRYSYEANNMVLGLRGGVMTGTAHEYVYYPDGTQMSELIWDMQQNYTVTADINYRVDRRWSVYAAATIGLNGNNHMDDYDWLQRPIVNTWTDHSWHDDTGLNSYIALDANMSYDFLGSDAADLTVLGGVKYTDMKMTARGGCYLYSTGGGFHNQNGCFTPGQKGITYEQSMPALYSGIGGAARLGRVSLSARALGGLTVSASDVDTHWMRGLVFTDQFGVSPYLGFDARALVRITDHLGVMAGATYDHFFRAKGSTDINGAPVAGTDVSGASLETLNVTAGLAYTF